MTPDIEALARQAGLCLTGYGAVRCTTAEIERFASIMRDQALEEAAQGCERRADNAKTLGRRFEAEDCAHNIRTLKGKP